MDECKCFSGKARSRQSHTCKGVEVYLQPVLGFGLKRLTEKKEAILDGLNSDIPDYSKYVKEVYPLLIKELKLLNKTANIKVADLTNAFERKENTIFLDAVHFSDEGNEIIADRIFKIAIEDVLK